MYNITLICTTHTEIGNCNSRELYRIIEEIKPEIIFEELSLTAYNECYGVQNRITLETSAIKMYLQKHKIEHIPVVGSELSDDLKDKFNFMIRYHDYRNLIDDLASMEEKYGFQFLISQQCEDLFENIKSIEKLNIKNSNDENLLRLYQLCDESIDKYENEIIKNVYSYSEENKYNIAIIFIGAAHRKSIMQKIKEYQLKQKLKLNCTLYNNQVF